MIIICTASADTYITNKIINGKFRATDANVGKAATLDLFKLHDETKLDNSGSQSELSRALIKFDISPLTSLTGSILDINSSNFSATLQMRDIMTGHACFGAMNAGAEIDDYEHLNAYINRLLNRPALKKARSL